MPVLFWLFAAAFAGGSTVVVRGGQIHGTVDVARAPADVVKLVGDPAWVSKVEAGGTSITGRRADGDCLVADYFTPSFFMDISYTVRQCRTASGYVQKLLSSDIFSAYETEWAVTPVAGGSRLSYRMMIETSKFPQAWVLSQSRSGIENMLDRIQVALGAVAAAP